MRHLEFLAAYDINILYTLGKGNRVADALSRKLQTVVSMMISEWNDLEVLSTCEIRDRVSELCLSLVLCSLEAHPSLLDRILEAPKLDPELALLGQNFRDKIDIEGLKDFDIDSRGGIRKFGRLIVPNIGDLRKDILEDSHRSNSPFIPVVVKCTLI